MSRGAPEADGAGTPPLPPADPALERACIPLARRIVDAGARAIGLVPADEASAVPPVAMLLGRVLATLPEGRVAVVDANFLRPAFPPIEEEPPLGEPDAPPMRAYPGGVVVAQPRPLRAGDTLTDALGPALAWLRRRFTQVLVDLTGFDRLGEEGAALRILDASVIVARAGRTTSDDLAAAGARIPEALRAGVVLVG